MTITAQKYTFTCRFESETRLPGYLGSTLRGAPGWALKKSGCVLRRQQCAYTWKFETQRYQAEDGRTINTRPTPLSCSRKKVRSAENRVSASAFLYCSLTGP